MRRYAYGKIALCEQLLPLASKMRLSSFSVAFKHCGRPATQSLALLGSYWSVHPGAYVDQPTYNVSAWADAMSAGPATSDPPSSAATSPRTVRDFLCAFVPVRTQAPTTCAPSPGKLGHPVWTRGSVASPG